MITVASHETLLPNDDNDIQLVPWRKDAKLRHPRGFSLWLGAVIRAIDVVACAILREWSGERGGSCEST